VVEFLEISAFAENTFDDDVVDWLQKNWLKFQQYIENKDDAEDFIFSLAYIYMNFFFEAYVLKDPNVKEPFSIPEYIEEFHSNKIMPSALENQLYRGFEKTLKILSKIYGPEEFALELASLRIHELWPHIEGAWYIQEIFDSVKEENKDDEDDYPDNCPF